MSKKALILLVLLAAPLVLLIFGCMAQPNPLANHTGAGGKVAGFWLGLAHGLLWPFYFLASMLKYNVGIYDVHNNGIWYNLGFVMGFGLPNFVLSAVSTSAQYSSPRGYDFKGYTRQLRKATNRLKQLKR